MAFDRYRAMNQSPAVATRCIGLRCSPEQFLSLQQQLLCLLDGRVILAGVNGVLSADRGEWRIRVTVLFRSTLEASFGDPVKRFTVYRDADKASVPPRLINRLRRWLRAAPVA